MESLHITKEHLNKLLCAQSGDAALLYLYFLDGGKAEDAQKRLNFSPSRYSCALATLHQLGLKQEEKKVQFIGQRPEYSETDVIRAADSDLDFAALTGEVQRLLGRNLTTEELKILLGFVRYLGLPTEVVGMLVHYCKERAQDRGSNRNPSFRAIEKEAYFWAEHSIDTMEEAAAFMKKQKQRRSRMGQLMELLQIRGRNLTSGEEKYAQSWLDMGFSMDAIGLAYERTCLNTGGLAWAYMNKILLRWQEQGLLTAEKIKNGDKKTVPMGATGQMGQAELDAIAMLKEG